MFETEKHPVADAVVEQDMSEYVADRCDEWHVMADNLMDWQCSEGPFEDGQDMCPVCDGPLDHNGVCAVCK